MYFGDVVREVITRRGLLKAGAVLVVTGAGQALLGGAAAVVEAASGGSQGPTPSALGVNFVSVPPNNEDRLVIPDGYRQRVLIRWGDPVLPGAPAFNFANQTAAAQTRQFGYNNDFCGLVPMFQNFYFMVSNHQYTNETMMFAGYDPNNPTLEQVKIAWAAHGISVVVVEAERSGGLRARVDREFNRRITVKTQCTLRGPAAGSDYLKTSDDPAGTTVLGTLNNCGGGVTPWGTVLSAEKDFHQYFANASEVSDPVAQHRLTRYGIVGAATERKWERFDSRFDLAQEPNEVNRFGWIVEVDPIASQQRPVKHTALGRFKHEAGTMQVATDGRVVCYMGDGDRFEYLYKFVSDQPMVPGSSNRDYNKGLLDNGTLYVARFEFTSAGEIDGTGRLPSDGAFDGSGIWIPLAHNDTSFVPGLSAEEVYVFTRLAADLVGATKMDRPEDVEPNPLTGRIYAALTNNIDRGRPGHAAADEANPRNNNRHGHVLELEELGGDHTAVSFNWRLLLVCGDPADASTYFAGYDKTKVSPISCPDSLAFDAYGNLWIATGGNALGANDGLFAVPLEGSERGHLKQFLTVPIRSEACGPAIAPYFVLVAVQHPGQGGSVAAPISHWPDGGASQPRPAVVSVYKPGRSSPGLIGE